MTETLQALTQRVASACARCGRDPAEVTIVGAGKRQPLDRLLAVYEAGLRCFGENRVQEAEEHRTQLPDDIDWHLIGPLQSNKAQRAAELFSTVHSVDRFKIARKLDRAAAARGATLRCFLQVNIGEEETKSGFAVDELRRPETLDSLLSLDHLELAGLMAIPPPAYGEEARPAFRAMAALRDDLCDARPGFGRGLSMGMSDDFEVAVEEGATHIRLGSILFGERPD